MDGSRCELRWMWLPLFLAQNTTLMNQLRDDLSKKFVNLEATDRVLDDIHAYVVQWLQERLPTLRGLDEFLKGIREVRQP